MVQPKVKRMKNINLMILFLFLYISQPICRRYSILFRDLFNLIRVESFISSIHRLELVDLYSVRLTLFRILDSPWSIFKYD